MPFLKILVLIILCTAISSGVANCQSKTNQSTTDSTKVYRKIEQLSKKSKFNKMIYSLLFRPLANKQTRTKQKTKRPQQKVYARYQGKIIRSIHFESLDPFGYNINDTTVVPHGYFVINGNKVHIKTKLNTLKNLVQIKENQAFDSLYVKESERLIRNQSYVRDVNLRITLSKIHKDSVDIVIRVLDNWSIDAGLSLSTGNPGFSLKDQNFLGFGHTLQPSFHFNTITSKPSFGLDYLIPNYHNTFITGHGLFVYNEDKSFIRAISLQRTFYTSYVRWAGGINLSQQLRKDSITYPDSITVLQPFKSGNQDLWLARSWRIFNDTANNRQIANFVLSGRFIRNNFQQRPTPQFDSLHIYLAQQSVFWGIGISDQKFIQDKYIFKFGYYEDIPIGSAYGLVGGYQIQNKTGRLYAGAKISWGNYYNWGYLSTDMEYGNFYHGRHVEQGAISISTTYFTALFQWGGWRFRQFIKSDIVIGIHRFPTDTLSIINNIRPGENIWKILGQHKIVISFQTQSYAPFNVFGFRIGPYLTGTLATLGTQKSSFRNSRIYSFLGIGILIKNEFLVMNNFEIALTFFPRIPDVASQKLKFNSYKPSDFGVRNFDFSIPQQVIYR